MIDEEENVCLSRTNLDSISAAPLPAVCVSADVHSQSSKACMALGVC